MSVYGALWLVSLCPHVFWYACTCLCYYFHGIYWILLLHIFQLLYDKLNIIQQNRRQIRSKCIHKTGHMHHREWQRPTEIQRSKLNANSNRRVHKHHSIFRLR